MKPFTLCLAVILIASGCASTNTGDPVRDELNRVRNARDRKVATEVGRGLARFLDEAPPQRTLEQTIFDKNP